MALFGKWCINSYMCDGKGSNEIQNNVIRSYLWEVGLQKTSYISADLYSLFYRKHFCGIFNF